MESRQQSPRIVLGYYYLSFTLRFLIVFIIALGFSIFSYYFNWSPWVIYSVGILLLLQLLFFAVQPWILYHHRYFTLKDNHIMIINTFFFKKEAVIKLDRVQYLERKTGPLLNRFGLCKNHIVTAGHKIVLPLIDKSTTKDMEEYCMNYLEKVDADV
ncbi:PH domain-containing protein [Staphylococcus carnosus]|uniref:YdbS-like PH domain-containing protein n=3 Tax=Staphylococcus carnosus TaxID=1281 RepID=B9DMG8_STACT|nr:PH domain-containing protein [Staphylococcus carnosus]KKB24536.1 hypothetical protein VV61_11555 [Staphylococcus carnosus]PNZ98550.1 hypothetical protein CD153_10670 [Staphylococcus carnosus]QPT04580.1 PH domain-containing protein [Staphylococcus carnosus]QQS84794.1 PH domain-containing protein [Staphylococcus carnosus]QRQ04732.1 PH domain-containing protein [Staphylococcus carnosus]